MKTYTVAVLGATGAVGQEMIRVLQERNFPVGKLVPRASARSAGKTVKFHGEDVTIQEATDTAFKGVDIVLGAAENDIAKKFAPAIVASGAVFVDDKAMNIVGANNAGIRGVRFKDSRALRALLIDAGVKIPAVHQA